ncbi:MAG: hypothetical protein JKY46_00360 [Robiginitomaculum sp.]|nr:hypothetical protein [Robiginitomaculum sp.]
MQINIGKILIMTVMVIIAGAISQQAFAHPGAVHDDKPAAPVTQNKATSEHDGMEMPAHADGEQHAANGEDDHAASEADAGGHSHWGLDPDSSQFSKVMAGIGKYHPLVVHFPIALFLTAALAQAMLLRGSSFSSSGTVRFMVWMGLISVIGAGLLGWAHSGPPQPAEAPVMFSHRWIGTSMLAVAALTVWLMEKARSGSSSQTNLLFNLSLFLMAALVAINGFLGGALAHGGIKHLLPW